MAVPGRLDAHGIETQKLAAQPAILRYAATLANASRYQAATALRARCCRSTNLPYWAYEYAYKDGRINVSSMVNDLEIPTIGVINGPGFHTEMLLMCDITICSEDAIIYDLHYDIGSVPGDGIHSCFQELLGVKRAAYALLTGQTIDAKTALEYGMVNEIHPREKLIERAYKLADHIMTQPRTTRRMTTQIVRRPWRRQITDSLDGGFAMQMFAHLAKNTAAHGRSHIGDAVAYVRKGKRNNFD